MPESFEGIDIAEESSAMQMFPNLFQKRGGGENDKGGSSGPFYWYSGAASVPLNTHNVHYFDPNHDIQLGRAIVEGAKRDFGKVFLYRMRTAGKVAVVVDGRTQK